jgi:hypothetical protein
MALPCRWAAGGLPDFAGVVRFRRRFGYPGRIDSAERVWLTFAGVEGRPVIAVNGQSLETPSDPARPFEYEITSLLTPRNELTVEVDGPETSGLWGEVALEIRRSAFLREVVCRVVDGPRLSVSGFIVGTAERPLELYAVLGRSSIAYATEVASQAGTPFTLTSEVLGPWGEELLRVELVDAATVWYTTEQAITIPPA